MPAPGMFPSPGLAAALAALAATAVFVVDTVTPSSFAVAVLYVLVVLLAGNCCRGRALVLVAAGCAALTLLSFGLTHSLSADGNAVLRCVVSLATIALTTALVLRNQAVAAALAQRASLLDLTHDTVLVRDMGDTVTYWNKGAEELYGWSRAEALGRNVHELLRTACSATLPEIMDELLRTGRWEGELVHTARDGRRLEMASRWHLQRNAKGRPVSILETDNDIADRKRAEAAAARHREELQLIIDRIPALVWTSRSDRTPDYVSARWEESGYSRTDFLADWRLLTHPEDLERLTVAREQSRERSEPLTVEHRVRHKDGSYRWHLSHDFPWRDETGATIKWYGVSIDIEDRKQAEQALARNQIYLTEAQRLSRTGSFAWKPATGQAIWSAEARRMWQLGPDEEPTPEFVLGRVHPDDRAEFERVLEQAGLGAERFDFEHRCVMPDGSVRYIRAVAQAHVDDAGAVEFLGAAIDLTEAKQAEEALQQTQAELAHLTRVTTMGELAASIAHEVSQPLAGIITHGEASLRWLNRAEPELDEVRSGIQNMIGDGRRAAEVIRKLRALARRAEMSPALHRLDEVLEDALTLVQREIANHRVRLELDLAPDLPPVNVDRVHLQQVFINLVLNAIQAMDAVEDRPRRLAIRAGRGGSGEVWITFRDSGIGIDAKAKERLFEPFYTTKTEGMGMGLAISRTIMAAHGGRIWAPDDEPPGASFCIALPAAAITCG